MSRKEDKNLIVGLDIGTSKVVVIVGEVDASGAIEVVGIGSHPSRGLKKGVVVNIESTVQSIQQAIDAAEQMAGCRIHSAYTGISGSHIRGINSHGVTAIKDQEVTQEDVERVMEAAQVVAIPTDQKILHILPREFSIDGQEGIQDPVGMSGVRLEARVHIVTGAVSAVQNIVKCVQRCGLEVDDIILQPLASSRAVLNPDEKELGVCVVDMGGTIISEYEPGMPALKQNFVARNRIISALSDMTIITESAEAGGSLRTASFAVEQNKIVGAIPGNITSSQSIGTNNLIKSGATPITCAQDVLNALGIASEQKAREDVFGDNKEEQLIIDLMKDGVTELDEIQQKSQLDPSIFSQTITMLELSSKIRPLGAAHWTLR